MVIIVSVRLQKLPNGIGNGCVFFQTDVAPPNNGNLHGLFFKAEKSKGVVTHSSGNFAQALSLAAKK